MFFAFATGWVYRIIAILCNFANISLLFHYLNKELLGLWFLMLGAQALMGLFDFGFGQTLQRRIAFCKASCGASPDVELNEATREDIRILLRLARRVYAVVSVTVFGVMFVAGWVYFQGLNLNSTSMTELRLGWAIMSLGYAINTWASMVDASLNGLGDIGWSNVVASFGQLGTLAGNLVLLEMGFGINGLAAVWLIKGVFVRAAGWGIVNFRHRWLRLRPAEVPVAGLFRNMVHPSLSWWFTIVGYFFMTGVGQYLIARFLGAASLPDYAATYSAMSAAQGAMVSVVSAGSPLFAQALRAGEGAKVKETIVVLSRYCLGLLAAVYGFLGAWGREAFELWLGDGHFVGYPVLGILTALMLAEGHQGMFQPACLAAERLEFYKSILLGGLLTLLLSLVLIPRLGLIGAAVSSLVGQAATQHWVIPRLAMKVLGMRFFEDVRTVLFPAACFGGAVFGAGIVLRTSGIGTSAAIALTAACALFFGSVFFWPLRHAIYEKFARLRRPLTRARI